MNRTRIGALLFAIALLGVPSTAAAQPEVVVHVADGTRGVTVVVIDAAGARHECTTDGTGSCALADVAAGRASVVARHRGAESGPRPVMIPATGKVSIIVPTP